MEKQNIKIRAPRGFKFKIEKQFYYEDQDPFNYLSHARPKDKRRKYPETVNVLLINSTTGEIVGNIDLERFKNRYVTHSDLQDQFHNKGIGIIMYAKAIQWCHKNGYKVSSSGSSSLEAQRLWASRRLRKWFKIVKRNYKGIWDSRPEPTWYVYPRNK